MAAEGATVRVPTTVNAISIDRRQRHVPGMDEEFARNADRLPAALDGMGGRRIFSCTP